MGTGARPSGEQRVPEASHVNELLQSREHQALRLPWSQTARHGVLHDINLLNVSINTLQWLISSFRLIRRLHLIPDSRILSLILHHLTALYSLHPGKIESLAVHCTQCLFCLTLHRGCGSLASNFTGTALFIIGYQLFFFFFIQLKALVTRLGNSADLIHNPSCLAISSLWGGRCKNINTYSTPTPFPIGKETFPDPAALSCLQGGQKNQWVSKLGTTTAVLAAASLQQWWVEQNNRSCPMTSDLREFKQSCTTRSVRFAIHLWQRRMKRDWLSLQQSGHWTPSHPSCNKHHKQSHDTGTWTEKRRNQLNKQLWAVSVWGCLSNWDTNKCFCFSFPALFRSSSLFYWCSIHLLLYTTTFLDFIFSCKWTLSSVFRSFS